MASLNRSTLQPHDERSTHASLDFLSPSSVDIESEYEELHWTHEPSQSRMRTRDPLAIRLQRQQNTLQQQIGGQKNEFTNKFSDSSIHLASEKGENRLQYTLNLSTVPISSRLSPLRCRIDNNIVKAVNPLEEEGKATTHRHTSLEDDYSSQSVSSNSTPSASDSSHKSHSIAEADFNSDSDSVTSSSSDSDNDSGDNIASNADIDEDDDDLLKPLSPACSILVRILICLCSIALLWITCFSLANYLAASVIGAPTFTPIADKWVAAFQVTDVQADLYQQCTAASMAACNQALNQTVAQREMDWQREQEAQKNQTAQAQSTAIWCDAQASLIQQDINVWVDSGAQLVYEDYPTCSMVELNTLKVLLGDRRINKNNYQSLTDRYMSTTSDLMDATLQNVNSIQVYNEQFLQNQTDFFEEQFTALQDTINAVNQTGYEMEAKVMNQISQLRGEMQKFRDCIVSNGGNNVYCPGGSLVAAFAQLQQSFSQNYNNLLSGFQNQLRAFMVYTGEVTQKLNSIRSFLSPLYQISSDLSMLHIDIFSFPSLDDLPPFAPDTILIQLLANVPDVPDIQDYFSRNLNTMETAWDRNLDAITAQIQSGFHTAMLNSVGKLQTSLDTFQTAFYKQMRQYSPPPFLPSEVREQLQALNEDFSKQSNAGLDELLAQVPSSSSSSDSSSSTDSSDAQQAAAQYYNATMDALMNSTSDFWFMNSDSLPSLSSWIDLSIESFDSSFNFGAVFLSLVTAIGAMVVVSDLIYRNYQSVSFLWQFTRHPQELLPPLDVRSQEAKDDQERNQKNSMNMVQKVASHLLHPRMILLLTLFLLIWLIALFLSMYIPLYQAYEQGCIKSNEGTFFSANAYAILYNYAKTKNAADAIWKATQYESMKAAACARDQMRQTQTTATSEGNNAVILLQLKATSDKLSLIHKCLDASQSFNPLLLTAGNLTQIPSTNPVQPFDDATFIQQCKFGADTNTWVSLGLDSSGTDSSSSSTSSSSSSTTSSSGSFNCSWISECPLKSQCPGPDAFAIRSSTYDSACLSEFTVHQCLFYGSFIVVIYLCLNVSRVFAMKAMIRLAWKALTNRKAGLTVITTVEQQQTQKSVNTRVGKETSSKEHDQGDTSQSRSTSPSRSASTRRSTRPVSSEATAYRVTQKLLKKHIRRMEQNAIYFLIFSIVAHTPYLILLFALKDPFEWGSSLIIRPPVPYSRNGKS